MALVYARDWVAGHAEVRAHQAALISGDDGRVITWSQLEFRVSRLAGALRDEFGVGKGDLVAVLAYGDPRFFELQFALMRLGAIMVPLNWRLSDFELVGICRLCEPVVVVHDSHMRDRGELVVASGPGRRAMSWACPYGSTDYEVMLSAANPVPANDDARLDDVTHVLYTSGTTGQPKGALSTHRTMVAQAINAAHVSGVAEQGAHHLNPMPLFHAGGIHALANPILYFGGQVTVLARFVPTQSLRVMSANRTTHFNSVPAFYSAMSELPEFEETDLSSMRLGVVAGAVAEPSLLQRWHDRGVAMQPQYGATETGPVVTALLPARDLLSAQRGSAGQQVPDVEIRLVDPVGADVAMGETGEIWLRGPAITPGYWRAEKADYFTEDWFRTGDAARLENGQYFVSGRTKEMYKSGGENVYPAEVERALSVVDGVADIAVIGVPDATWGEVGVAVVVCEMGTTIDLVHLRAAGADRLARYKLPQRLVVVEALPRNVTGKINRAWLRDKYGSVAPSLDEGK